MHNFSGDSVNMLPHGHGGRPNRDHDDLGAWVRSPTCTEQLTSSSTRPSFWNHMPAIRGTKEHHPPRGTVGQHRKDGGAPLKHHLLLPCAQGFSDTESPVRTINLTQRHKDQQWNIKSIRGCHYKKCISQREQHAWSEPCLHVCPLAHSRNTHFEVT
jgi:hypothetical protein